MAGAGFGVTSLGAIAGLTIVAATGAAWIRLGVACIVAGVVGPGCVCNGSRAAGVAAVGAPVVATVATRGGSGRMTGAAPSARTASMLVGAAGLTSVGVTAAAGVAFGATLAVTVVVDGA